MKYEKYIPRGCCLRETPKLSYDVAVQLKDSAIMCSSWGEEGKQLALDIARTLRQKGYDSFATKIFRIINGCDWDIDINRIP